MKLANSIDLNKGLFKLLAFSVLLLLLKEVWVDLRVKGLFVENRRLFAH